MPGEYLNALRRAHHALSQAIYSAEWLCEKHPTDLSEKQLAAMRAAVAAMLPAESAANDAIAYIEEN
jgi:hypothetical protein